VLVDASFPNLAFSSLLYSVISPLIASNIVTPWHWGTDWHWTSMLLAWPPPALQHRTGLRSFSLPPSNPPTTLEPKRFYSKPKVSAWAVLL
jgi:hypothetical protein